MVVSSLGVGTWRSELLSHVKGGVLVWCFVENLIDRLVTCKEIAENLIISYRLCNVLLVLLPFAEAKLGLVLKIHNRMYILEEKRSWRSYLQAVAEQGQ